MKKFLSMVLIFLFTANSVLADNLYKTKLKNGQTVIVKEVRNNPTVIIDTWVKTGSVDENDKNNGTAHFLEHLFFKGSENYPTGEFDKIIEAKGASTNAATSKDYTHFYILIPSKDFETAVKLHADMLTNPLIPKEELEKERFVVIREIEKNNDNPGRILYRNLNNELYKNHPYKREVIGTKDIIKNISRDEILDFYNKNYLPENLITVVVGDVNTKDAVKLIENNFSKKCPKTKQKCKNKYIQDALPSEQKTITDKQDVNTTYMLMGFKTNLTVSEKDSFALDLLSIILGGGRTSRLYKDLYDEKQIVHNISAYNSSMKEDSVFYISVNSDEENLKTVKEEIFNNIKKIQKDGVTENELSLAKKMMERETLYSRESIDNTAVEIGYTTLITDDWNFYDKYLTEIKKIELKDIKNVANKYLQSNTAVISVITPKNKQETAEAHKTPEKTTKDSISNESTILISEENFYKPQKVSPVKTEQKDRMTKYTLKNGATLITGKHKNNEIIAISIKVKGGNLTEEKQGVSAIMAGAMTKGTEKYPKNNYSQITEENGIKIVPSSNTEYFSINTQCIKSDINLCLDLLYQVLNKAVLDSEEINKIKTEALHSIKRSRDNSSSLALENLETEIYKNSPFYISPKILEKNIPTITKKETEEIYENIFNPKNIVVTVNGDFDEQEMINYFSSVFNSKNPKEINFEDYKNQINPITEQKTITTEKGEESAWIFFGWLTDGVDNQKDRITVRLINAILGSGMSSRLFSNVRAEKGLAYTVASTTPANSTNGAFYIYIGTDPNKTEDAQKAILEEVEKLKTEFVSDKELQDAKDKLKGQAILAQETNSQKAEVTSLTEINGTGCDYYFEKFNKLVDEITVTDIIETSNKYFSKPYIVSKVIPKK